MRTLHHGSDHIIEKPLYGKGKPYNDYGLGFYCTEYLEMANEWAVGRNHDGFANSYSFDDAGLTMINLASPDYCTLHWLAVLLEHRFFDLRTPLAVEARTYLLEHFSVDISAADVVAGYRADDSYFTFAQDFLQGAISYRQLENAMKLGHLGQQVMVKSARAFERLQFMGAQPAARSEWLARRELRDAQARAAYFDVERNARRKGDVFIERIIDERWLPGDQRLKSAGEQQ